MAKSAKLLDGLAAQVGPPPMSAGQGFVPILEMVKDNVVIKRPDQPTHSITFPGGCVNVYKIDEKLHWVEISVGLQAANSAGWFVDAKTKQYARYPGNAHAGIYNQVSFLVEGYEVRGTSFFSAITKEKAAEPPAQARLTLLPGSAYNSNSTAVQPAAAEPVVFTPKKTEPKPKTLWEKMIEVADDVAAAEEEAKEMAAEIAAAEKDDGGTEESGAAASAMPSAVDDSVHVGEAADPAVEAQAAALAASSAYSATAAANS